MHQVKSLSILAFPCDLLPNPDILDGNGITIRSSSIKGWFCVRGKGPTQHLECQAMSMAQIFPTDHTL